MKKILPWCGLLLLLQAVWVGEAYADRTAHRPWLARRSEPRSSMETRRTNVSKAKRLSSRAPKGDQIVQQAIRYRGTRYRFGGDSKRKGFDCSGLVRRIYNDLQLKKLPHTSSELYKMGKPVRLNDLQPGDLVFFKNTYRRGISHVGVYAGDNRFVHAQSSGRGVTVTSFSEPYYQLHYAGARRLY